MANHGPVYGLDADLKAKIDAKYEPQIEAEARAWIEAVLGEKINNLHEDLKDGVALCNLMNKIRPGLVKKINKQKTPFMMMENIGFFLKGCAALGINKVDQFMTVDLFEAKNLGQVIHCLHALGRHVSNSSTYQGPKLGLSEVPRSSSTVTSPVKASNDDADREAKEKKEREEREQQEREANEKREREEREAKEKKEREANEKKEQEERDRRDREAREAKEREEAEARAAKEQQEQREREQQQEQAQKQKEREEQEQRDREERERVERENLAAKEQEEREAALREARAREEESERKEKELQLAKEAKEEQDRAEQAEFASKQAVLLAAETGPVNSAQIQALLQRLEQLESAKNQIESKLSALESDSKELKQQLHTQTELNGELTKNVASLNKILEDLK